MVGQGALYLSESNKWDNLKSTKSPRLAKLDYGNPRLVAYSASPTSNRAGRSLPSDSDANSRRIAEAKAGSAARRRCNPAKAVAAGSCLNYPVSSKGKPFDIPALEVTIQRTGLSNLWRMKHEGEVERARGSNKI